jgi:hypothetical protein
MYFSHAGGIEVEENWDTVQSIDIPLNRKDDINQFLSE